MRNSVHQAQAARARPYRSISYVRPIDAAKKAVSIVDLANRLTSLRRSGKEYSGHCPLPDHTDRTPSFTVNDEKGVFYCHGCGRGGDVIELARLAWDYDKHEAHVAAAMLLMEFGHVVPNRPPAWFRKQERQQPMRDAIKDAQVEVMMRRLWRWIYAPILAELEDAEERTRMGNELWRVVLPVATRLVEDRRSAS